MVGTGAVDGRMWRPSCAGWLSSLPLTEMLPMRWPSVSYSDRDSTTKPSLAASSRPSRLSAKPPAWASREDGGSWLLENTGRGRAAVPRSFGRDRFEMSRYRRSSGDWMGKGRGAAARFLGAAARGPGALPYLLDLGVDLGKRGLKGARLALPEPHEPQGFRALGVLCSGLWQQELGWVV